MIRRRLFFSIFILLLVPVFFMSVSASSVDSPAPVIVSFPAPTFDPGLSAYISIVAIDTSFIEPFVFMVGEDICVNVLYGSDVLTWHLNLTQVLELSSGVFLTGANEGFMLYSSTTFNPSVVAFGGRDSFPIDSSLLSDLSDTAGAFLSTVGQIVDSIVSSPLLLVTVGIFFLGGCVALLGRFLGKD